MWGPPPAVTYLYLPISRCPLSAVVCWPWRSHLHKLHARHAVVFVNEGMNPRTGMVHCTQEVRARAAAQRLQGLWRWQHLAAAASTGGSASRCRPTRARTAARRSGIWDLRARAAAQRLQDCTQTTQHTLRTPRILGFVDHLQKAVDHTLASREKREWSTTLVRMVDHPLQPVKKLWLVAGVETTLVLSEWSTTPSGVGEYLFFA